MTKTFQIGKTYSTRSICDYDCVFSWTVIARTAKRLTLRSKHGKITKRGVFMCPYEPGVEHCKPTGSYSMCPIISADKAV